MGWVGAGEWLGDAVGLDEGDGLQSEMGWRKGVGCSGPAPNTTSRCWVAKPRPCSSAQIL